MLTIENYNLIKTKTYSYNGKEWLLYSIKEFDSKYQFYILPKVGIAWDNQNGIVVSVYRDTMMKGVYQLETEGGATIYFHKKELNTWISFMSYIAKANLI